MAIVLSPLECAWLSSVTPEALRAFLRRMVLQRLRMETKHQRRSLRVPASWFAETTGFEASHNPKHHRNVRASLSIQCGRSPAYASPTPSLQSCLSFLLCLACSPSRSHSLPLCLSFHLTLNPKPCLSFRLQRPSVIAW